MSSMRTNILLGHCIRFQRVLWKASITKTFHSCTRFDGKALSLKGIPLGFPFVQTRTVNKKNLYYVNILEHNILKYKCRYLSNSTGEVDPVYIKLLNERNFRKLVMIMESILENKAPLPPNEFIVQLMVKMGEVGEVDCLVYFKDSWMQLKEKDDFDEHLYLQCLLQAHITSGRIDEIVNILRHSVDFTTDFDKLSKIFSMVSAFVTVQAPHKLEELEQFMIDCTYKGGDLVNKPVAILWKCYMLNGLWMKAENLWRQYDRSLISQRAENKFETVLDFAIKEVLKEIEGYKDDKIIIVQKILLLPAITEKRRTQLYTLLLYEYCKFLIKLKLCFLINKTTFSLFGGFFVHKWKVNGEKIHNQKF